MIPFEKVKELFKQAIDNSENMNEALQKLVDKIYEQGKADALGCTTQMIDKSNFDPEQYKMDLDATHQCGYNTGYKNAMSVIDDIKEEIKEYRDACSGGEWDYYLEGRIEAYTDALNLIDKYIGDKNDD